MREEKTVENTIKEIRLNMQEVKTKQFLGSSNIKIKEFETPDAWDVDENVSWTLSNDYRIYGFYIHVVNQVAPIAAFRCKILIDGVVQDLSNPYCFRDQTSPIFAGDTSTDFSYYYKNASMLYYFLRPGADVTQNIKIKVRTLINDIEDEVGVVVWP